jgi:hypothetical protein
MGPKYLLDARKSNQPPDFSVQLRIQSVLEEMALTSIRCIAEAAHTPATTVFHSLTEVLRLRFRHWR